MGVAGETAGVVMRDVPKDSHEAWIASRSYYPQSTTRPWVERIQKVAETQRPTRRLRREAEITDLRRFSLPMMATHFPEAYDSLSRRETKPTYAHRVTSTQDVQTDDENLNAKPWLLSIGKDRKTIFPYSLVSHRAFLESQSDPRVRASAEQIAPLQLT